MKVLAVTLLFGLLCVTIEGAPQYTTKFDNIDVERILNSDRLLRNYVNCLLDKGRCTPEGQELKKVLPDVLQTGCEKCSEKQKNTGKMVVKHLLKNKRNWWNELEAKFDPSGQYKKKFQAELKKEGIDL